MASAQSIGCARCRSVEAAPRAARRGRSAASARAATADSGRRRSGPAARTACAASRPASSAQWRRRMGPLRSSRAESVARTTPPGPAAGSAQSRRPGEIIDGPQACVPSRAVQRLRSRRSSRSISPWSVSWSWPRQWRTPCSSRVLSSRSTLVAGLGGLAPRGGNGDQDVPQMPSMPASSPGKESTSVGLVLAPELAVGPPHLAVAARSARPGSRPPGRAPPPGRASQGQQPARAGLRIAVGVLEDDLGPLRSLSVTRPDGWAASPASGRGVEVEARVVDPLVEDVREHPQERLRDAAQVGERQVGVVELAVLQAVVDDGADQAADLGRRRLDQRAARRLDGVGEHQHAHHLVLRLGARDSGTSPR